MTNPNNVPTCHHHEVRAYADPDDDSRGWAICSYCEFDITDEWWGEALRDGYRLIRTRGDVQIFNREAGR